MAVLFRCRGYPQWIIIIGHPLPPKALISEPDEIPADQPGTIPVILTYHPTNVQVKNIITRNLHLVRDDPEQQQFWSPYAFYVRIAVIATYATLLWESAIDNRTATAMTMVLSPVVWLDATPAHIPTYRPLLFLPEDTLGSHLSIPVSEKTWCTRLNAVLATKRSSERLKDA